MRCFIIISVLVLMIGSFASEGQTTVRSLLQLVKNPPKDRITILNRPYTGNIKLVYNSYGNAIPGGPCSFSALINAEQSTQYKDVEFEVMRVAQGLILVGGKGDFPTLMCNDPTSYQERLPSLEKIKACKRLKDMDSILHDTNSLFPVYNTLKMKEWNCFTVVNSHVIRVIHVSCTLSSKNVNENPKLLDLTVMEGVFNES